MVAMIEHALGMARESCRLLADARSSGTYVGAVNAKEDRSLVTETDMRISEMVEQTVKNSLPGHRVLSEEIEDETEVGSFEGPWWIVDPVDGTTNLVHGLTDVASSLAFVLDGKVEIAVVVAPFRGEEYVAVRGKGARLNGGVLAASEQTSLDQSLMSSGFPHDREGAVVDAVLDRIKTLVTGCRDVHISGSGVLSLCDVAAGRLDGYVETVFPWDIAAAGLIAVEAGARRSHVSQRDESLPEELDGRDVLVSAPGIHDDLVRLLSDSH